jgi:hypothetical protein
LSTAARTWLLVQKPTETITPAPIRFTTAEHKELVIIIDSLSL